MKELLGYQAILNNPDRNFVTNNRRKLSARYAAAEVLWYLSRTNNIEMIKAYAPQYEKFSDDGITANGAYGYRIANNTERDQLHAIVEQLSAFDNSRRIVLTLWKPEDLLYQETKDLPCTLTWQFIERNNQLHMVCTMRSQDVWLGLPYDIFVNTTIQRLIANQLAITCGAYVHQVGSLHLYEKHYKQAEEARSASGLRHLGHDYGVADSLADASDAITWEDNVRKGNLLDSSPPRCFDLLHDLCVSVGRRWGVQLEYQSPVFKALLAKQPQ